MSPDEPSSLSLMGLLLTLCMAILLLGLPRRHAIIPIAIMSCFMTFGQLIVIAGLHFTMLRVLVLVGCMRIIFRGETRLYQKTKIDNALLLWLFFSITTYTLQVREIDAFINRIGFAYDAAGLYFLFRILIRDFEDVERVSKVFALVLLPVAICMSIEHLTGRNLFSGLGGVPEFSKIRDGVIRCQGPFAHPILAGTYGSVWISLFVGIWWKNRRNWAFAILGIFSSSVITFLSGSSGPIGVFMAGLMACVMWIARRHMRAVRRGFLLLIALLQLLMQEPVWFIFARINIHSASTGWHRANLIDKWITHFFDWWLVGVNTDDVEAWGVWWGDITNQFILEAVRGGVMTFVLFIAIVVKAFRGIGKAMDAASAESNTAALFLWSIGCTLFAHVVAFQNIAYTDQNIVNWYLCLAMVAVAISAYSVKTSSAGGGFQSVIRRPGTHPILTGAQVQQRKCA